ncbi:hypothetical protein [uncultured Roseovarius sp.]|uniref:hypothetical protein n=1 Tax=uncultured Roseovarius sp. TaxID=293344 RepID=UPI002615BC3C|nr:hypothetical protein [uncultured Roseovarius sp.]
MRHLLSFICAALLLLSAPVLAQNPTTAHYDLLFRNGTLDDIPRDDHLTYTRAVINTLEPDTQDRDTGQIELSFDKGEAEGDPLRAHLKFIQGEKYRNLGQFPASVGNPIILYFVETVVRDMAETAGGSPFYIRNRIKESLVEPAETKDSDLTIAGNTVSGQSVILRPFEGDPNSDKMKGFGDLSLEVTMSEDVPGWYHTLRAYVPGAKDSDPIYSSTLTFDRQGDVE